MLVRVRRKCNYIYRGVHTYHSLKVGVKVGVQVG